MAALTDFSLERPETWPTLDPAKYEAIELGDTWATVCEGGRRPSIWARERYDWSDPTKVTWTVQESDAFVVTALRLAGERVFLSTYKPVFDALAERERANA